MRIKQAYISPSVADFSIHKDYGLAEYYDSSEPCVFFGMYREEDFKALIAHSGMAVVRWCGHDAMTFNDWDLIKFSNIHHVTPFPKVAEHICSKGFRCKLIRPSDIRPVKTVSKNGNKVYAYCPKSFPGYHGHEIIKRLKIPHKIIIGDGSISQEDWKNGASEEIYKDCFVGLFLSSFAGGGAGIIEMGLRGKRVITNVLQMPHTISWNTIEDIERSIMSESRFILQENASLSTFVKQSLDPNMNFLHTEIYARV